VTHLRQIMLEELRRRNYAESTIHAYIRTVEHFAGHFHCPPDQLGLEHIRQYQAAMFTLWKFAPNTVTQRLAALRFFYIQVLKRGWCAAETPYPKKVLHLPHVLSQEEVARLIDAAHLKISDIDSQRMVVHIRGGKGRKDRDVMLSPALLDALRVYWRGLRHKPPTGCFPATDGIRRVIRSAPKCSGLPVRRQPNAGVLRLSASIRTPCVIALRRICSNPGPTCAPSRCCWGIVIWKRQRSTCTSRIVISAQPPVLWMRSR
jgi:integrase